MWWGLKSLLYESGWLGGGGGGLSYIIAGPNRQVHFDGSRSQICGGKIP